MSDGGIEGKRGYEFEAQSLLNYLLLRVMTGERVVVTFEKGQDAAFVYPEGSGRGEIVELVQSKKAENRPPAAHREPLPGWDPYFPGTFNRDDLKDCIESPTGGPPIPKLLEEPCNRFTVLVCGDIANSIARFVPEGLSTRANFSDPSVVAKVCPAEFEHATDPDSTNKIGLGAVARRVRIIASRDPNMLGLASEVFLRHLKVPAEASESVFNKLLDRVRELYQAVDTINRQLTSDEIEQLIARHRYGRGRWRPGVELLQDRSTLGGIGSDRCNDAEVFCHSRFWRHSYLEECRSVLFAERAVVLCGAVCAGKTTICKYLTHEFLRSFPDSQAYYLAIDPEAPLDEELEFFEANLNLKALFVIDDEQCGEDVVRKFVNAYCASQSSAFLVVTSTKTYSASQAHQRDHPLHTFASVKILDFHAGELQQLLRSNIPGLRDLTEEQRTFVSTTPMTGGKIGLAVALARFFEGQQNAHADDRVIDTRYARNVVTRSLKDALRISPDADLDARVPALLALSSYVPLPPSYCAEYGQLLVDLCILAPTPDGRFAALDISIPRIVSWQNRTEYVRLFYQYLEDHPHDLAIASMRLVISESGRPVLAALIRHNSTLFAQQLSTLAVSNPDRFTALLQNMRRVASDNTRTLLRDVLMPRGSLNRVLISQIFEFHTTRPIRTYTAFFTIIHRVNSYLASSIFGSLVDRTGSVLLDQIVSRLLVRLGDPGVTLAEAFSFIGTIYRCHSEFGIAVHNAFLSSDAYREKRDAALYSELKIPELIPCCDSLRLFDVKLFQHYVTELLSPAEIVECLQSVPTTGAVFELLHKLHRTLPRIATDTLRRLWLADRDWFDRRLRLSDNINIAVAFLSVVAHIHRRIALDLASTHERYICALTRKERDDFHLAASVQRARGVSYRLAKAIARQVDTRSLLTRIQNEQHQVALIGGTLSTYARIWPPLLSAILPEIDIGAVYGRISPTEFVRSFTSLTYGLAANVLDIEAAETPAKALVHKLTSNRQVAHRLHEAMDCPGSGSIPKASLQEISLVFSVLIEIGISADEFFPLLGIKDPVDLIARIRCWVNRSQDVKEIRDFLSVTTKLSNRRYAEEALQTLLTIVVERHSQAGFDTDPEHGARPQSTRRSSGKVNPKDIAEIGELLSIAAAINEDAASELASSFTVLDLIESSVRDQNLGRQSILVRGLHAASRSKCLQVVEKLYGKEAHILDALDSNERIDNVVQLIINLQKIARMPQTGSCGSHCRAAKKSLRCSTQRRA